MTQAGDPPSWPARTGTAELRLESVSSRYVGGRRVTVRGQPLRAVRSPAGTYQYDVNDAYYVEQAYMQRFVPAERVQEVPVLLVHGGGLTGVCWETTPDGRPGWLTGFLRAGLPVDVLDNMERGRAGWCSLPGIWEGEPVLRGERDMWLTFRIGDADGYPTRTPFPGCRFPVRAIDAALRQSVPRWPGNADLATATLADVVRELGLCVLVGHSEGGGLCAKVAAACPEQVRALVMIEPHGLPVFPSPPEGYPPQLTVIADYLSRSPVWTRLVKEVREYSTLLHRHGVTADLLDLPAEGIRGNSHNPMMDTNSDQVAGLILNWLAARRAEGAFA
jgi:pimeloyl-ACP methyl ester carboxylesterase